MKSEAYPLHLLSLCLCRCADKHEFNRYFNEYYECISKRLMPHVKRRLFVCGYRGDLNAATADIWRDVFDEHYQSIFINRAKSAERIQVLAESLNLTSRGELFSHQVIAWKQQVVNWTDKVMAFLSHPLIESDAYSLEQRAQEINRSWSALRDQGYRLLDWLLPRSQISTENESVGDDGFYEADNDSDEINNNLSKDMDVNNAHNKYRSALKRQIVELGEIIQTEGDAAADAVAGCMGGAKFGVNAIEILEQLSKVLIPMMPTLYWLTNNRIMDYLRHAANDPIHNQFEREPKTDDGTDESDESLLNHIPVQPNQEEWNSWNDIQMLLQQPVIKAQAVLQQIDLTDKQRQKAQVKLQRCEHQYNLNLIVIELMLEGNSEEAIALYFNITRDQVRGRKKEIRELLEPLRNLGH